MGEARPAPFFVGEDLALDFLNTVTAPWGRQIEWLGNGADLVAWLEQAHAMPTEVLARFRGHTESHVLDAVASQARDLREWFRVFVRDHAGKPLGPPTPGELAPVNQLLEQDEVYRQIETVPSGEEMDNQSDRDRALRWKVRRRWHGPKALLFPLAEAIGELVCQKDFTLVRACEGPSCTLWFFDVSKGHVRRWCSMAVCGNRAKAAAHRARARQHPTGGLN